MAGRFADAAAEALRAAASDGREGPGGRGAVESVVVRVVDAAGAAFVTVERLADGVRTSCSCGRRPCPHAGAALEAFCGAASAAGGPGRISDAGSRAVSGAPPVRPSDLASAGGRPAPSRPSDADLSAALGRLLDSLIEDGIAAGSERVDAAIEALVAALFGTDAYGLHRSLADLRREVSTARPSPDLVLRAVEVLAATRRSLDAGAGSEAYGLLVGRDLALSAMETREDVTLLEVARNSARTPFGYRRDERFFVDLTTGGRFAELIPAPLGGEPLAGTDRYRGSVGPFPRLVRGDLVAVEPGPDPRRIRLLQYRVELPVKSEDIRRLLATAAQDVATLYAEFSRLAEVAGSPHPCLAVFAPSRVVFRDGEATLLDAGGLVLPLARATAPDACMAADRFLARGRAEIVVGHMYLFRRTLALAPLSLLMDLPRGERLVGLR